MVKLIKISWLVTSVLGAAGSLLMGAFLIWGAPTDAAPGCPISSVVGVAMIVYALGWNRLAYLEALWETVARAGMTEGLLAIDRQRHRR